MDKSTSMRHPDIETMPRESLRDLQGQRLREQVAYVYENSPFYRRKYDEVGLEPGDIKTVDDVRKLPFVSKDELRKSQDANPPLGDHVCVPQDEIVWLPTTSGTTGTPLLLPRNQHDFEIWTELNARAYTTAGVGRSDVFQMIHNYTWLYAAIQMHAGLQQIGTTVINAGMGATEKQMWALEYMGVTAFHATPSYLNFLGNKLAERDRSEHLNVHTIVSGGEVGMAGAEAKARLKELFPTVRTFSDIGGVTDIGTIIWVECLHMSGGHLSEDSVICEILDTNTDQPVSPGEVGELVFTDVVSKSAPLLRYRVNDLTRIDESICECGRTSARLPDGILGRADDMITVRAGNVYPSAIDEIIKSFDELSGEYQMVVDRPGDLDEMTLRVERSTNFDSAEDAVLVSRLEDKVKLAFGSRANIELTVPGELPTFVYKAKRIIDRRKGETEADAMRVAREQGRS